jgi:hypothetical protein
MSLGFPGIGGSGNSSTFTGKIGSSGTAITSFRFGTTSALSGGTLVVSDTGCTANSLYFFSTHALGTITVAGSYYCSARTPGTSFAITSNVPTDTSTVDWHAIN